MIQKTTTRKGFVPINQLIGLAAKQYKLENVFYRQRVIRYWREVAGSFIDEARELTQAVDFKKGVLTVACLSREAATQIKLLAQRIIYALNQCLGRSLVYAISIEV